MNKIRPSTISRIDPREDGFVRMSNVTNFLAAAAGTHSPITVPSDELLEREDLIECTPEALHRVAKTIIALVKSAGEATMQTERAGKVLHGQGRRRGICRDPE